MKYKIASPNNDESNRDYISKLADAFADNYFTLVKLFTKLDILEKMIGNEITDVSQIKERLQEIINPYKK